MLRRMTFAIVLSVSVAVATDAPAEIIHAHAKRGNLQGVLAELEKGVPLEIRSTNMTSDPGVTPLFVAAKFGKTDVVRELLARGADPSIFFTVPDGEYHTGTALHHAARFGYRDVVELLLQAGADPASYHPYIATPLHQARRGNHHDVADLLIEAGAPERLLAEPIDALLPEADQERGAQIAKGCDFCHGEPRKGAKSTDSGPNLWGVFGRPAAAAPDFDYSPYLKDSGFVWDAETLNHYLASPYQFLPGTSKLMFGIENDADRAALIAYLATLAD